MGKHFIWIEYAPPKSMNSFCTYELLLVPEYDKHCQDHDVRSCFRIRSAYLPSASKSSWCVPCSITEPFSIKNIWSACWIEERRCAMMTHVRPLLALSSASCTALKSLYDWPWWFSTFTIIFHSSFATKRVLLFLHFRLSAHQLYYTPF